MAYLKLDDDCELYYVEDDYTPPWETRDVVMLVHGVAEHSGVWFDWIPRLASHYRLIRLDLRGFGASSVPPPSYSVSVANFADEVRRLIEHLDVGPIHLICAKLGGTIGMQLATMAPELLRSLTVIGSPAALAAKQKEHLDWVDLVRDRGVRTWAETTMRGRLGRDVPQAMFDWWIDLMSSANPDVLQRLFQHIATVDLTPKLSTILTPTLMITGAGSVLADTDTVKRWADAIPNCRLHIVQGTSYHVAATDADECAPVSLDFLRQLGT